MPLIESSYSMNKQTTEAPRICARPINCPSMILAIMVLVNCWSLPYLV